MWKHLCTFWPYTNCIDVSVYRQVINWQSVTLHSRGWQQVPLRFIALGKGFRQDGNSCVQSSALTEQAWWGVQGVQASNWSSITFWTVFPVFSGAIIWSGDCVAVCFRIGCRYVTRVDTWQWSPPWLKPANYPHPKTYCASHGHQTGHAAWQFNG